MTGELPRLVVLGDSHAHALAVAARELHLPVTVAQIARGRVIDHFVDPAVRGRVVAVVEDALVEHGICDGAGTALPGPPVLFVFGATEAHRLALAPSLRDVTFDVDSGGRFLPRAALRSELRHRLAPLVEGLAVLARRLGVVRRLGLLRGPAPHFFVDLPWAPDPPSPPTRLAVFDELGGLLGRSADELGVEFVDITRSTTMRSGHLLARFQRDGVHANEDFGRLALEAALTQLTVP